MAILVECSTCKARISLKNKVCKCGKKIPAKGRAYWITLRDSNGKQHFKRLGQVGIEFARDQELEWKQAIKEKRDIAQEVKITTWKKVAWTYLNRLDKENRNKTYQNDSHRYLKRFSDLIGEDCDITTITKDKAQEFKMSLLDKGLSKASIDRHIAACKAAWETSIEDLPNPFRRVKMFHPDNRVHNIISEEEIKDLLKSCRKVSEHLFQIVALAAGTGLRKNNILNLKRSEVDFENRTIHVTQKGNKRHTIGFGIKLAEMLKSIPDNGTEYFWISPVTGKPYHRDWRKTWKSAKKLAGVSPNFRFHDLRHVYARNVLNTTGNVRLAQKLLGHSDVRVTERYTAVLDETQRATVDLLDPLLDVDL